MKLNLFKVTWSFLIIAGSATEVGAVLPDWPDWSGRRGLCVNEQIFCETVFISNHNCKDVCYYTHHCSAGESYSFPTESEEYWCDLVEVDPNP